MHRRALIGLVAFVGLAADMFASQAAEPVQPIEPVKEVNLAMVELGKKLYFDPRLSKSGFISCMKTLTGDQPSFALPILPPSTDDTPAPQPFD